MAQGEIVVVVMEKAVIPRQNDGATDRQTDGRTDGIKQKDLFTGTLSL